MLDFANHQLKRSYIKKKEESLIHKYKTNEKQNDKANRFEAVNCIYIFHLRIIRSLSNKKNANKITRGNKELMISLRLKK
jgi:hypothetical protein